MCGIVGVFDLTGKREFTRELISRMNETQYHRGPDEGGIHIEPGVGLGHRRLSIIDLSSGQQPLFNEDGSVVVTYNGEIYNFPSLSEELKACGHVFKTHCDTEVIVHAWEEWGEACVERFRGMFAFAIWDRNQQSLFLARDRLGIKPLYYSALADGIFAFSSELKALKTLDNLPREIDPTSIEDYFTFGYVPEPKTIFKQVYKLRPGHTLLIKSGSVLPQSKEYWDIPFIPVEYTSEVALKADLVERMREAVKIRMVADVPLGAFLSGGVDSSAIVAMMAQLQDKPVHTCAIGFDVKQFNETEFAKQVANQYKTDHYEGLVSSDDFDLLDTLVDLYDEPYADSSAIPTYRVCQLAKSQVTVALSGDGGDENFAGYRRYRWHMNEEKIRAAIPLSIRRPVFGLLGKFYPKADWAPRVFRAKTTFQGLARSSVEAYLHTVSLLSEEQRNLLFSDQLKAALKGYKSIEVFNHYVAKSPTQDPLSLIQYLDMKTYLVGDILTKVDRASMAHALEVRVPLLDHKFIEWVSGLPSNIKLKGQEGKYILKSSLEPYLPNDVLYRDKMGFGVPLAKWFRGPLKEKIHLSLLGETIRQSGFFNMEYIEKVIRQHQSGARDYSVIIWSLLMFNAFLERELESAA
ncbi:XrtA/PEP-CTERM system amidotransferase [Neptunomonas qingdaonensis]|uniref:asparagine synthase (glutamine-hydrolyzing) n=1 Tax=Neptunomonas qingdaonensis TaxID=1045558 RepID=A0A1I2MUM1_9GAMM|nr:XrtA/PEP-CTERM system amidotransferase [Neptunomonas qingdaonensis]SFF95172.1 asparagine synthase (glutamine-hydrolysing) [Neptunomonas qingdaonensis]